MGSSYGETFSLLLYCSRYFQFDEYKFPFAQLNFWPHALNTATYLLNILPSKHLGNLTSTHLLYHKSPSYTHLRIFGCLYFPLIPSTTIHKLQHRSSPCVFLATLPRIGVTSVIISFLARLLYLNMFLLTSPIFPFAALMHHLPKHINF